MGAGLVGTFVGGRLAARGHDVRLVGRAAFLDPMKAAGLVLADDDGEVVVPPTALQLSATAEVLAGCEVVLVAVKGKDTAEAGRAIAPLLARGAIVVSLQNGVRNPDVLRAALPGATVCAGTVTFNVVRAAPTRLVRTTSGPIVVAEPAATFVAALRDAGFDARTERDMAPILWGKLLINLNNAVNALAGTTLAEQLADRGYRRVLAAVLAEGLRVVAASGQSARAPLRAPLSLVPHVLRLPTPLFRVVAKSMVTVSPGARSSMQEDLARGRPTEIDALNGEIVAVARSFGREAPVNARIVELVRKAEGAGSPRLSSADLRREVGLA